MIHCTTYTDSQGKPLGYFMEFQNVTEEKDGIVKPVRFAQEFLVQDYMILKAQEMSERYTVGIVYKTEVDPDYLA